MEICVSHSQQYILYCANCDCLLCLKCMNSHGSLAHPLLSSREASKLFNEKLLEYHRKLKAKQESVSERILELSATENQSESFSSFCSFRDEIQSVFQRIEKTVEELKASTIRKYSAEYKESSANETVQLEKQCTRIENETQQIECELRETANWICQFEWLRAFRDREAALLDAALLDAASGFPGDGECRGSRARPTAATVALEVLQTLRARLSTDFCDAPPSPRQPALQTETAAQPKASAPAEYEPTSHGFSFIFL